MWINGRRRPDLRLWQSAKEEFAAVAAERAELLAENDALKRQFDWLLRELQDVTDELRKLRAAALARAQAHAELAELYRTRAIQQAERSERDPMAPLQ